MYLISWRKFTISFASSFRCMTWEVYNAPMILLLRVRCQILFADFRDLYMYLQDIAWLYSVFNIVFKTHCSALSDDISTLSNLLESPCHSHCADNSKHCRLVNPRNSPRRHFCSRSDNVHHVKSLFNSSWLGGTPSHYSNHHWNWVGNNSATGDFPLLRKCIFEIAERTASTY